MKRAIPYGLAVLVLAAVVVWYFARSGPRDHALAARELATRRLAEHLAQKFPGERALLISNPFTQNANTAREIIATEEAGIEGFKEGLGDKLALEAVAFPELKPDAQGQPRSVFIDGETTTPLSFLVADNAFDKLAEQHPRCGLFASLIGLPANVKESRCWQEQKPRFALLLPDLRFIGNAAAVKEAVQKGKLAAMVLAKPGASGFHRGVAATDFDRLFILVTADNVEKTMLDHPQLFPPK